MNQITPNNWGGGKCNSSYARNTVTYPMLICVCLNSAPCPHPQYTHLSVPPPHICVGLPPRPAHSPHHWDMSPQ